jgi:hypothetical protein
MLHLSAADSRLSTSPRIRAAPANGLQASSRHVQLPKAPASLQLLPAANPHHNAAAELLLLLRIMIQAATVSNKRVACYI